VKLLHVTPAYPPARRYGGPLTSVHGLARALVQRGHEVEVLTTNVDVGQRIDVPLERPTELDGVRVRYFDASRFRRLYRAPGMKAALRGAADFDLVHVHALYNWPAFAAARAAERAGVPWVVSPRGMLVRALVEARSRWLKTAWIRAVERRTLERAAAVHATSAREAADLRAFELRWPPVFEVPNGVEAVPESGTPPPATTPAVRDACRRDGLVLFLGRVNWKKGLDRLVEALIHARAAHLVVAGPDDGYAAELAVHVERLGLGERVTCVGAVDGADKRALLAAASVLAVPSYHENFGNVVLEAMAAGLPVVATPEVGASAVLREHGAGRVAEGEPGALAAALTELLDDPSLARSLGAAGRSAAREHFGWPALAERMERAYRDALERPRGASPAGLRAA